MSFVHLHVHSSFSVLDGMSRIEDLVDKAIKYEMPGIALTDHGSMYGIKEFLDYVKKVKKSAKEQLQKGKISEGMCQDTEFQAYIGRRSILCGTHSVRQRQKQKTILGTQEQRYNSGYERISPPTVSQKQKRLSESL